MSPPRGDGLPAESEAQALRKARGALRSLLKGLHVLDALPERSRMLAVDAELPVHAVLTAVLSEQHPHPHVLRPYGQQGPGEESQAGAGGAQTRREGPGAHDKASTPLGCGVVSPALPSNVLAEVCEFEAVAPSRAANDSGPPPSSNDDEKQPATRRGWTSPDDGWGGRLSIQQDLEKMPMGMPVTVGELAGFLAEACDSAPPEALPHSGDGGPARWAEPVGSAGGGAAARATGPGLEDGGGFGSDMLDWSLAEWRAHCLKQSGEKEASDPAEPTSRLFVEERPQAAGPVLVHRVPMAPPRPILCTDDQDASLLKAVELLLAYPELDALPIVSPVRCTVVAHLTLSYCLAYILTRLRGSELCVLGDVVVSAEDTADGGKPVQRIFDSTTTPDTTRAECWAERRAPAVHRPPWVLTKTQPLRQLLTFFARTHHSGVPVVEDTGNSGGGVVGLVSRRDLLHFLDLAMQSARRPASGPCAGADAVSFNVSTTPIKDVLDTLRRFRTTPADEGAAGIGASLVYEKELTLKVLLLRVLRAENRKLLFVQDKGGSSAPKLLRILSIGDVWHLLIGSGDTGGEGTDSAVTEENI